MIIPNRWENKIDVPNHQPDETHTHTRFATPGNPENAEMGATGFHRFRTPRIVEQWPSKI